MKPATSKVFLAYLAFQGDAARTALALKMRPDEVVTLAEREGWKKQIDQHAALKEGESSVQVQVNRVLNYIQARQLGSLVDEVIKHWSKEPEKLVEELTKTNKFGSHLDTKPLADLVKAAALVQEMTCKALGDRGPADDAQKASNGSDVALSVFKSLDAIQQGRGLDAVSIVKKSLGEGSNDSPELPRLPQG